MENYEQEFLSDVLSAVSDWRCSYDDYYESDYSYNYYCIDITFDDEDWQNDFEIILDTIDRVCSQWHDARYDYRDNIFELALVVGDIN